MLYLQVADYFTALHVRLDYNIQYNVPAYSILQYVMLYDNALHDIVLCQVVFFCFVLNSVVICTI